MSNLSVTQLLPLAGPTAPSRKADDPAKVRDAAKQFEALLLGQILIGRAHV